MSRIFTKLFFAVAFLLGLLNTAFADNYKATMKFSGNASGESTNVDAIITKGDDGKYSIKFIGFEVNIPLVSNKSDASCEITSLEGKEDNGVFSLSQSSDSKFTIVGEKLDITSFSATIGNNGKGEGSFSGGKNIGFMNLSADCDFTLTKVVDTDTIVEKELSFDNVPFYNKAIDMLNVNDTIKTNNDSSAVGIQLFKQKASFVISDYEISLSKLSLRQRLVLENLSYKVDANESVLISGTTNMYVKEYDTYVPAKADIVVAKDGSIDGTVEINVNMVVFNYQIIIVFGKQAEGVVVETKILEYTKTDSYSIKSDEEFVFDSKVYFNNDGLLIENIKYSIVDQKMSFLIKDLVFKGMSVPGLADSTSLLLCSAEKAEAYILLEGQNVYLKDVNIDLKLNIVAKDSFAFGSLTINEGGSATNNFVDPNGPFEYDLAGGMLISMAVDTTGNELDGYTADSEFKISGIYDYADGMINSVKLVDLDQARSDAIEAKMLGNDRVSVMVVATDKDGNSSEFKAICYVNVAPISFEEIIPSVSNIREISNQGYVDVKIDPFVVKYIAKNDSLDLLKEFISEAKVVFDADTLSLPLVINDMKIGKYDIKYVWNDPISNELKESKSLITVYADSSDYSKVSNVANKAVSVIYKDGVLNVNGVDDANVSVVNISGTTIYNGKAGAINLHKGIYIVKVARKAYKVVVK